MNHVLSASPDDLHGRSVMVVDDAPENLKLLTVLLKRGGLVSRPFSSGSEAIASALTDPPDLVLLDVVMPEMSGLEVCRTFKRDDRLRDIPIIFISGLQTTSDKVEAFRAGGSDYVSKPFHEQEVLARVKAHLHLRRLQLELVSHNLQLERRVAEQVKLTTASQQSYQERLRGLSMDLTLAEERERRRIAEDLHSHVGHDLALARNLIERHLQTDPQFERIAGILDSAIADTRSLVFELSPPALHQLGLIQALQALAESVTRDSGVQVEVVAPSGFPYLDEATRVLVFRAVKELLHNVVKHAHASHASVTVQVDGVLEVAVCDDGVGFDPSVLDPAGFGLWSIRERLGHLGGDLTSETGVGCGARLVLVVPLSQEEGSAS